ncbi:Os04g0576200 [Oryza sativa Japonica Group]|uniref:Os04g0576200 protein n=1 Tax=Oryza sativa subsp. japonica TaxID=39947 RepID=A0A0P0WE46_ORYSJ|nr:Os04g0576200 [Oryza sativa Japonica Group]
MVAGLSWASMVLVVVVTASWWFKARGDGDGGGDGVSRGREGGIIGPCAATSRCSAVAAPLGWIWRVAGYGGRRQRATCDGWRRQLATAARWSRQLAATASANDAGEGIGGSMAEGDNEKAAGSGGGSRRRWLVAATAVTGGMAALDG